MIIFRNNHLNKFICSTDANWVSHTNGTGSNIDSVTKWDDNAMCQQNCFTQNVCSKTKIGGKDAYTCDAKGGENIGGDLGGNYFTSQSECNSKCKIDNQCETYSESNCTTVEESLDN